MNEPKGKNRTRPLLFEKCPRIAKVQDWIPLGNFPTPIERMKKLGEQEGITNLYVKRDDLSSNIYGGNKVRKLEFLLACAKARRHRALLTFGAAGSNHLLACVIHAERLGIRTIGVIFPQPNAAYVRKNLLLDHLHGAVLVYASSMSRLPFAFAKGLAKGFSIEGGRLPYVIPPGGTNIPGCLGYVEGALELANQIEEGILPQPDFIFITLGSSGTAAGLLVGLKIAGISSRVIAVRVVEKIVCNRHVLAWHANRTAQFISSNCPGIKIQKIKQDELTVIDEFAGERYAKFTKESIDSVKKAKELEGLVLDGTYTGKTLAATLDFIKRNNCQKRISLFINTYNSVDLSESIKNVDYRDLPSPLHRYFETPTQEEELESE